MLPGSPPVTRRPLHSGEPTPADAITAPRVPISSKPVASASAAASTPTAKCSAARHSSAVSPSGSAAATSSNPSRPVGCPTGGIRSPPPAAARPARRAARTRRPAAPAVPAPRLETAPAAPAGLPRASAMIRPRTRSSSGALTAGGEQRPRVGLPEPMDRAPARRAEPPGRQTANRTHPSVRAARQRRPRPAGSPARATRGLAGSPRTADRAAGLPSSMKGLPHDWFEHRALWSVLTRATEPPPYRGDTSRPAAARTHRRPGGPSQTAAVLGISEVAVWARLG